MKRVPFYFIVFITVVSCVRDKVVSLEPSGYKTLNHLTLRQGDLNSVFVDNSEIPPNHRAGYNGITQLYHTLQDSSEIIRFTQSPTGGGKLNPAWDYQYLIPDPEAKKEYGFNVRIVYKPFISNDDIKQEYEKWEKGRQS